VQLLKIKLNQFLSPPDPAEEAWKEDSKGHDLADRLSRERAHYWYVMGYHFRAGQEKKCAT